MNRIISACVLGAVVVTSQVLAADGWKGPGDITFVQPEIYRQNDVEGGLSTIVGTTIQVPDCNGSSQWLIRADLDPGNRIYAAVLAAFTSGKKVELYQWSCTQLGGVYYARIGAVKVQP